jgi:uncharacterized protein
VKRVRCPRCRKETEYSPQNEWRPFCSERCKMIDLGKWAAEDYRVESETPANDEPSSKPPES